MVVRRRLWSLAAVAAGLALAGYGVWRIVAVLGTEVPWDFVQGQRLARAWLAGYNPYTTAGAARAWLDVLGPTGLGYPPTTAFWMLPLAKLDPYRANAAMAAASVALTAGWIVAATRALRAPLAVGVLVAGFVLASSLFLYEVRAGAKSALIAFLVACAWLALRRGREAAGGVALGLACTIKLFPGLLVAPFLFARRWRVVAGAAAAYLAIAAVMTARYGPESWPLFLRAQKPVADLWLGSIQNGSVSGVVARLFHPACLPAGPIPSAAIALATALSVALIAAALVLCRAPAANGDRLDLCFALITVLSVVASQWSWEHYHLLYVLPAGIALRYAATAGPRLRRFTFAVVALMALTWRIDHNLKLELQRRVRAGEAGVHVAMHVVEVASWLPGVLLLGTLVVLVCAVGGGVWSAGGPLKGLPPRTPRTPSSGSPRAE